jgi:peptidoglycan/LPS O-acetylase OafA/YrhL
MPATFRPEIAGLRAIAVVSVVLFHLKLSGAGGGFIGVDIFFVISGYLISRNICRDLISDQFSLGQFYIRRTRRIYPALIATVVATYVAGALWCSPLMFLDIAKECTHALLSIANIQYWRESHKYFAPNSDELAMLHCWSLSLEEQFYLVWPLFLLCSHKVGRIREAILVVTAASFVASILFVRVDPSAVFFLMPFRIFEFGCGAIILFVEEFPRGIAIREGLSAAGLAAAIGSTILMRPDLPYLEFASLVPCFGAAGIILGGDKTLTARVYTHPLALAVGAISYSLYLCHWPIIFFARFIFGPVAESPQGIVLALVAMTAVAAILHRWVELRFIRPPGSPTAVFWKNSVAFWSVLLPLVAITHATFLLKGLSWRLPLEQARIAHLQEFPSGVDIDPVDGPFAMQLVGDSHAVQYLAGLSPLMKRLGIRMEPVALAGCPILYGVRLKRNFRDYARCQESQDRALERLGKTILPIIFVQRWDFYDDAAIDSDIDDQNGVLSQRKSYSKLERALERTVGQFVNQGRHVLIIGRQVDAACSINLPRLLDGPLPHAALPPCPPTERDDVERSSESINQMLARIQAKWPDQVQLIRPVDYFCGTECPTVKDGVWLYRDGDHFTVAGSDYMVERAERPISQFLTNTLTLAENNDPIPRQRAANGSELQRIP